MLTSITLIDHMHKMIDSSIKVIIENINHYSHTFYTIDNPSTKLQIWKTILYLPTERIALSFPVPMLLFTEHE